MHTRKNTTQKPRPSRLTALENALAAVAQVDLPVISWDDTPVRRTQTPELIAALAALGAAIVAEHLERTPRFS